MFTQLGSGSTSLPIKNGNIKNRLPTSSIMLLSVSSMKSDTTGTIYIILNIRVTMELKEGRST